MVIEIGPHILVWPSRWWNLTRVQPAALAGTMYSLHSSLRCALTVGHRHLWPVSWFWRPVTSALLHPVCLTKSQLASNTQGKSYQSLGRPPVPLGCQWLPFPCCSRFLQLSLGLTLAAICSISWTGLWCHDHVSCLPDFSAVPFMAPQQPFVANDHT